MWLYSFKEDNLVSRVDQIKVDNKDKQISI